MADLCPICCDSFTQIIRKSVGCSYCKYDACVGCIKKYILSNITDPNCMNCKVEWNKEFIDSNLSKAFRIGEYKKHRENILVDREKSLLPDTIQYVELEIERRNQNKLLSELSKKYDELMNEAKEIKKNINNISYHNTQSILGASSSIERNEKKLFVKSCIMPDCRGFLSTQWKCGVCSTWVCPDCHEQKEGQKDENHKCNPDNVATAKLIAKDSKPCPKCLSLIYKVNGCFARDIPIPLWSGDIKMSQDIKIGDVLIGDDGNPRIVQDTCSGEDELFEVIQKNGDNYVVNSKHTLMLKMSGDRNIYFDEFSNSYKMNWFNHKTKTIQSKIIKVNNENSKEEALKIIEEFRSRITNPFEIEMIVDDYMKLNNSIKECLFGYKCDSINWPKKKLDIDPCNDVEVLTYLSDNIKNDRETRLKLFSIICDINSAVKDVNRIIIKQTNKVIVDKIVFLARSLGFIVNMICILERYIMVYNIYIYEIHKELNNITEDNYNTSITVKPIGRGKYYGWQIDCNKRFILNDMTCTHNCSQMWCTICHTTFDWNTGREIITANIHNPEYYRYIRDKNGGQVPRNIGDIPMGCGGLPNFSVIYDFIKKHLNTDIRIKKLNNIHRIIGHIRDIEMGNNVNRLDINTNRDLRISYLLKEISEEEWKKELQKREKKVELRKARRNVYEMFITVATDLLTKLVIQNTSKEIVDSMDELSKLIEYYNISISSVALRFNSKAKKEFNEDWIWI